MKSPQERERLCTPPKVRVPGCGFRRSEAGRKGLTTARRVGPSLARGMVLPLLGERGGLFAMVLATAEVRAGLRSDTLRVS